MKIYERLFTPFNKYSLVSFLKFHIKISLSHNNSKDTQHIKIIHTHNVAISVSDDKSKKTTFLHKSKCAGPPLTHTHTHRHAFTRFLSTFLKGVYARFFRLVLACLSASTQMALRALARLFSWLAKHPQKKEMSRKTRRRT